MTHVVAIELSNWFSFKGQHRVDLAPGVYAVTARHADDPDRSNWVGKSVFLSTMAFALEGWHPAAREDGWISHGETSGYVNYHLSDGATIARTRSKRSATKLTYTHRGATLVDAPAQAAIRANYGVRNETDLFMAYAYKQKELSRLLTMLPSERMLLVSDWLELGPLQAAEGTAGELSAAAAETLRQWQVALESNRLEVTRLETDSVESKLLDAEQKHQEANAEVTRLQALLATNSERHTLERDAEEFARLNERGLAIKVRLAAIGQVSTHDEMTAEHAALQALNTERGALRQQCHQIPDKGEFDGKCPVAGIECPARQQINENTVAATKLKSELQAKLDKLTTEVEERGELLAADNALAKEYRDLEREREQLRPRALKLVDAPAQLAALGGAKVDTVGAQLDAAQQRLHEAVATETRLRLEVKHLHKCRAALAEAETEVLVHDRAAKLARTSVLVYKSAQRVVAEGSMATIARDTNAVLSESSIDLGVGITWAREGNSPAKNCDQCGAGFPVSAKVKVCAVCGAARGKHQVEKLDIVTTDISGAAEDLAGIAIRLAASAWLRTRRGSAWSVATIDEPFGALDQANKRALSQHLAAMLTGRYGFAQAFVVAHDRGIMDALPNRLELVATKEGTRFG